MRRWITTVGLCALVAGGCGGEEPQPEDVPNTTAACREAFEEGVREREVGLSPEPDTETPVDAEGEQAEPEASTATLAALYPTLQECDGIEDWLAGARAVPEALPERMDRGTALEVLCRSAVDDPELREQLADMPVPCDPLPTDPVAPDLAPERNDD